MEKLRYWTKDCIDQIILRDVAALDRVQWRFLFSIHFFFFFFFRELVGGSQVRATSRQKSRRQMYGKLKATGQNFH